MKIPTTALTVNLRKRLRNSDPHSYKKAPNSASSSNKELFIYPNYFFYFGALACKWSAVELHSQPELIPFKEVLF
jgi:hypothetical protein